MTVANPKRVARKLSRKHGAKVLGDTVVDNVGAVCPHPEFMKTKLCKYRVCPYGDRCFYAHSESELRHVAIEVAETVPSVAEVEQAGSETCHTVSSNVSDGYLEDSHTYMHSQYANNPAMVMFPMSMWPPFINPTNPYEPVMSLDDIAQLLIDSRPDYYTD